MPLTAREYRVVLFLVCLFFLGLFVLSRLTNEQREVDIVSSVPTNAPLRLTLDNDTIPETVVLLHKVPGITVFKNLYIHNETIYIVTSEPDTIPERRMMISNGFTLEPEDKNEPTEKTLSIITPSEAELLFRGPANVMEGVSFIQTDGPQFLGHMYHFVVEIFALWHWRCYTSPDLDGVFDRNRPPPRRYIFPHASRGQWQDHPGLNLWIIRAALGGVGLEFKDEWSYRMQTKRPFVMEHVVLGDRAAWHRGPFWKDPNTQFPLVVRDGWWTAVRERVTAFAGPGDTPRNETAKPLITYISRQNTRRRLLAKDHQSLIANLKLLCQTIDCELEVVTMENLNTAEQIHLLSRTTILLGVHGNGLSGQLWLKPSPRTAVIEIFYPGGFLYDYEYTARSLGHKHYGIWNDKYFTAPTLPPQGAPEGFQGSNIPVNGSTIASLIHRQLTLNSKEA